MTLRNRKADGHGSEGQPTAGVLESWKRGKDEMNLAEFPIAVVAEAARPGQLTLHFADSIQDKASGRLLDRSVTVHGTEEWGLPAAHDDDVMVALLQISHRSQWPKRIEFSRYELCQLLRWSLGGPSYERIYKALHRLSTTTYNYRHAWRDHAQKEWIPSQVFSYIQSLKINEAGRPTRSGRCEVTWSDDFHQSLLAGSLKRLDYELFVSLKSPIAKRLYRFLDKRFGAGRTDYTRDLHTLAFEKIGISRSYTDAAQIKRILRPAILELEKAGFLANEPQERRFKRVRRGQWMVHFRKAKARPKKRRGNLEAFRAETPDPPPEKRRPGRKKRKAWPQGKYFPE
jgi:hypothetical protein